MMISEISFPLYWICFGILAIFFKANFKVTIPKFLSFNYLD